MKSIDKISKDPMFWLVDPDRKRVKPFPGREPTRWRVEVQEERKPGGLFAAFKTIWTYDGKPNPLLIPRIRKVLRIQGRIKVSEYDQLGVFRLAHHATPCLSLGPQQYSTVPCYFYYPWSERIPDFFGLWQKPLFNKLIIHEQHRFYIHSPWEQMTDAVAIENLRSYRAWLRKENPWKSLI